MKTKKDYQNFLDELKLLCKKHGIFMIGTDTGEGIYAEISLGDVNHPEKCGWKNPKSQTTATLSKDYSYYSIDGIGL